MTKEELREFLESNKRQIFCLHKCIEYRSIYTERLKAHKVEKWIYDETVSDSEKYDAQDRAEIERRTALVKEWAKLISKDNRREVFEARYIDGLKCEEIEEKCHYSRSHVFDLLSKACKEIVAKSVSDLVTIPEGQAATL